MLVKKLRSRISGLKRSTTFVRSRRPDEVLHKLSSILDSIEHSLIPGQPRAAMNLLGAFLETDDATFNRVDDSYGEVGDLYRRACRLFAVAAKAAGQPPEAEKWFLRLSAHNNFGARDTLFDRAADILDPEALARLVREWRTRLASEPINQFNGVRIRLTQVAESMGDPELHEEATLAGRDLEEYPALALDVARVYLQCGQPEIALTKMPPDSGQSGYRSPGHSELLIAINRALGRDEVVLEQYWRRFEQHPSSVTAKELLALVPAPEQARAHERLREIVLTRHEDPLTQASFFAEMGEPEAAAQIVIRHEGEFNGAFYPAILELIKLLDNRYPLAASVLYRANLESLLDRAKSKNYRYPASYYHKLTELAEAISDWKSVTAHSDLLGAHTREAPA